MPKEIFYCNLTVQHNKQQVILKEVIYKETDGYYHKKTMFAEPVKVLKVDIIKSLGYEATNTGYAEVSKSLEHRNTVTGAYD